MNMEELTEGRIVHYVLEEGRNKGHVRPAIVVRVWRVIMEGGLQRPPDNGCCQLQVFTDGSNDDLPEIMWKTSVLYDPDAAGCWHWPNRAPARPVKAP